MKTNYYCKKCGAYFYEEDAPPNLNRVHTQCGHAAAIVSYDANASGEPEEEINHAE